MKTPEDYSGSPDCGLWSLVCERGSRQPQNLASLVLTPTPQGPDTQGLLLPALLTEHTDLPSVLSLNHMIRLFQGHHQLLLFLGLMTFTLLDILASSC